MPPHPSSTVPHLAPDASHVLGLHPQWLATPAPPHVCGGVQVPQSSVRPQPSAGSQSPKQDPTAGTSTRARRRRRSSSRGDVRDDRDGRSKQHRRQIRLPHLDHSLKRTGRSVALTESSPLRASFDPSELDPFSSPHLERCSIIIICVAVLASPVGAFRQHFLPAPAPCSFLFAADCAFPGDHSPHDLP
jgi:hypothetical protein